MAGRRPGDARARHGGAGRAGQRQAARPRAGAGDASRDELEALARAPRLQAHVDGKEVVKVVVVPAQARELRRAGSTFGAEPARLARRSVRARRLASAAMPETPRHLLALWALGVVVVALLGVRYLGSGGNGESAASAPAIRSAEGAGGRVACDRPRGGGGPAAGGLPAGARPRVVDAVRRAGGARPRAYLSALNLAAKVEDGRQVVVPLRSAPRRAGERWGGERGCGSGGAHRPQQRDRRAARHARRRRSGDGAGILEYREEHGGFGSVEELGQVPGIGEKRLAALREKVRV